MDYIESLGIWMAMASVIASIRERGAAEEANTSQTEEVFVPFHLPPAKPQPTAEAQPPVAVPRSEAIPVVV